MSDREAQLIELVALAHSIKKRAARASISNARMLHASTIFAKGIQHGGSMCALFAHYRVGGELDGAGICALARALIESHNVLLYLTEPGISKDEQELRLHLMYFNQTMDQMRIGDALGITTAERRDPFQTISRDYSLGELKRNQVFLKLDAKQQDHLLRGRSPFLMSRYDGPRPVSKNVESAVYNLFSHNVHTFGLAATPGGSATPAGFANMVILAVEVSAIFLAHMVRHYQRIRARAVGRLAKSEKAQIENVLSLSRLDTWVSDMRREGAYEC